MIENMSDAAGQFLKAIGGEAIQEVGGILADRMRLFRLKNQLTILRRAEAYMRQAGLPPKRIAVKLLVPLIEAASLEDEPSLQELWARLLAKSATEDRFSLHSITVDVLKGISPLEAFILKALHEHLVTDGPNHRPAQIQEVLLVRPACPWTDLDAFLPLLEIPTENAQTALDNLARFNLFTFEAQENLDGKRTGRRNLVMTQLGLEVLDLLMTEAPKGDTASK